jgi:hypothetical protein
VILLVFSAQVSLYYDLLPAACSGVSQAEFVSGRCGKGLARGRVACPARAAAARRLVWTELRPFRMVEAVLPGRVADPIRISLSCWIWIRIQISDPDPEGQK